MTRVYLTLAVITTLLCALEIVSPFSLYFNWNAIVYKFEVRFSLAPLSVLLLLGGSVHCGQMDGIDCCPLACDMLTHCALRIGCPLAHHSLIALVTHCQC